nr:hypothetical protein HK105_003313 [Polyrhizophydium stewartii]
MVTFHEIVRRLQTDEGLAALCGDFDVETARAGVAYRWVAECATPEGVVRTALRAALRGLQSLEAHHGQIAGLAAVGRADLARAARTVFARFLDPAARATVVVAPPGKADELVAAFGSGSDGEASRVDMRVVSLDDLAY